MDPYTPPKSNTLLARRGRPLYGFLFGLFLVIGVTHAIQTLVMYGAIGLNPFSNYNESVAFALKFGSVMKWLCAFAAGYFCIIVSRSKSMSIVFVLTVVSFGAYLLIEYGLSLKYDAPVNELRVLKRELISIVLIILGGKMALK